MSQTSSVDPMTALIVSGSLSVSTDPVSVEYRDKLVRGAEFVEEVTDAASQEIAVAMLRDLKQLQRDVETTRAKLKEPVLAAGRKLDQLAKDHVAPLEGHVLRLGRLIAGFQQREAARVAEEERARAKAIADAEEQEKAKKLEAAAAAGTIQTEADLNKAIEAEAQAKAAVAQTDALIRAPLPEPVREKGVHIKAKLDFEVLDIGALYRFKPEWVKMEPRRAEILAVNTVHSVVPGLRFFEEDRTVVRLR